jgi:DNA-binding XRE family transcriptional regulator
MEKLTVDTVLDRARRRRTLPPPAMRRLLRDQWGLTQGEVAGLVGVSRECISRYENGSREPRGPLRDKYVALLDRLARES